MIRRTLFAALLGLLATLAPAGAQTHLASLSLPGASPGAASTGAPLEELLGALASGRSPAAAYAAFERSAPAAEEQSRGRLAAAAAAYRAGEATLARQLLASPLAEREDYLGAYAEYLLGLLTRDEPEDASYRHFARAYERAGATELRYRAAVWLVDERGRHGDLAGALELLDVLAAAPVDEALKADFAVRRALVLERLGRKQESLQQFAEIYLGQPLLGYRSQTQPLHRLVRTALEGQLDRLPIARRVARAEALLAAGLERDAAREAQFLLRVRGADRARLELLLARTELARGLPRAALARLKRVGSWGESAPAARLTRARALRATGKRQDWEIELVGLARDEKAGEARAEAAFELARELERDAPERALVYYGLAADAGGPEERVDDASWKRAWLHYAAQDHVEAARAFGELVLRVSRPRAVARGTYWGARALERLGRADDAARLLAEVVWLEPAGYYGMLAVQRLESLAPHSPEAAAQLERTEPARRRDPPADPLAALPAPVAAALAPASELRRLGFREDAIAELEYQVRRLPGDPAPRLMLAALWHEAGNHLESVRWVRRAYPDLDRTGIPEGWQRQLYPLPFWDSIRRNAEAQGLDPFLSAAVIYQESRFRSDARSSAGAVGLMQLMPRTAKEISRKLKEPAVASRDLHDPERNIRYGSYYLRRLLDDLDGSAVHALAGYNAGYSRARRWSGAGFTELDEYVEAIPFRETRNYVKNILVAHQAYHRTYEGDERCTRVR